MRAISQAAQSRAWAPAQRVAWLLTLGAGEWTWRGATLALTLGADAFPARLAAPPHWSESLPTGELPGGVGRADAEVRVLDLPGAEDSLRGRLAVTPPVGMEATLALAWLDGTAPLDPADAAPMLQGRVTAWRVEPLGVTLTLADELQTLAPRRVGRLLHSAMLTETSPSLGRPLPWLFGRVEDAELLALDAGAVGHLAQAVDAAATVLPLSSLAGFPSHGRVQLGEELIDYTAVDLDLLTLGTAAAPLWRAAPASHPRGTAVRRVPVGGFTWLAADHPCHAVESVLADGVTVDPADWVSSTLELNGIATQVITMAKWPLNADGREAARLTTTIEGLADDGGDLIENPARIIERLLTDPRLGGLDAGVLDAGSFAAAAAALAAREVRFARRLGGGEALGGLLESAAREAALWVLPAPPIRLAAIEPTPQPAAAEEDLDGAHFLDRSAGILPASSGRRDACATARIDAPAGLIPPAAIELTGPPRTQGRGRPALRFPSEAETPGVLARRFELDWIDLTRSTAAADLGEVIWAHLGDAPFEVEQECPPGAALLTAGAAVRLTCPVLELDEALAWVVEVSRSLPPEATSTSPASARFRLRLRGPWAGAFAWRADALNYIRRYAFGAHLALTVGGAVAARLSRSGTLRLRGRLREEATLAAGPFAGPAALAGGKLYLNCPAGGVFQPFLALDAAGNADLAGRLRERSTLALDPAGQMLGSAEGRCWLSPDGATGALEFAAATAILHLKGTLIESVRL